MKHLFKKEYFILAIVLFVALILRIWNIQHVPPSPSMDEASISYNAYSILRTGGDEYGNLPGLSHRSYDDWRRAPYLYLVIPFVALFDLSVLAVRLPAIILSVLTVLALFYIVLELFSKRSPFSIGVALLSASLLTISPWHIYISRLGHESNAYLSFSVFGVLFFLKGVKNSRASWVFFSFFFFIVSMISYYAGQVFVPLFVGGLLFFFRKKLLLMVGADKRILMGIGTTIIVLIPLLYQLFSPTALVRFEGTSTFKPEAHMELFKKRVELRNKAVENNDIIGRILYSSRLFPVQVLIKGYFDHFKFAWLFANSLSEPHKVPNLGVLYFWQIPFIIIGIIVSLLTSKLEKNSKSVVFLWFLLGPVPAAIATQTPHAMRSYLFMMPWQIFIAIGLAFLFFMFYKLKYVTAFLFLLLICYSVFIFSKNYFFVFPKTQSASFQYALSKTIPYILTIQKDYKKVIFSNTDNLYQSYMFFLYFVKYDPSQYQKFGGTKSGGYAETHRFDKYEFRPVNLGTEVIQTDVLYVVNVSDLPDKNIAFKTFQNLDDNDAIALVHK